MKKIRNRTFLLSFIAILLLGIVSCVDKKEEIDLGDNPYSPNKPIVLSGIGPQTGGLGTRVVVSGSNFGNDKSRVKLFFNNKEALILSMRSNAIYAMVPKQPGDLSTIKVVVNEGKNSDGSDKLKEAELKDTQFKYNIKATVTTVAGILNVSASQDGTALEGTFTRPAMLAVDNTGSILVVDDWGHRIRQVSIQDNKLSTVLSNMDSPWQCSFNTDYSNYFVVERSSGSKPLLFYGLSRSSNWQDAEKYYDQKDDNGNYIAGNMNYYGLTADDKYVYMLSQSGSRLIRVDQDTRQVELIGQNLNMDAWAHIAYNKKNGYIYVTSEAWGRIYRFDPHHTPAGKDKPWITQSDVQHVAGLGKGSAKEGNGKSAQFGEIEGIAADQEGNVYFVDYTNHVIWKLDEEFNATILAGVPGVKGYKDGKPKEALFNSPYGITATPDGIVYVADTYNYVVRCIAIQ
ncbi:MAG: IPT/TIG domain-containing protein [Bacteroidota bacterium]|nr:IPT/TIG domain-containing protein [Bacteroidota bacterium]